MVYKQVLLDFIEKEKAGVSFVYSDYDRAILNELTAELNQHFGTQFHYLAELATFDIPNSSEIYLKYIHRFESESIRGYLSPQFVSDKIKDCDKLILSLYLRFKFSQEYISAPGAPAPAHIYTSYDNSIKKTKPKRLKNDLLELLKEPRDVVYLPFTMKMVASWKIDGVDAYLRNYLNSDSITEADVGLPVNSENYYPSISYIKRELKFRAISGLKYYPTEENIELISEYTANADSDIAAAAQRSLGYMQKRLVE